MASINKKSVARYFGKDEKQEELKQEILKILDEEIWHRAGEVKSANRARVEGIKKATERILKELGFTW